MKKIMNAYENKMSSSLQDTVTPQAEERLLEFTRSELFAKTFREGMDLVEETAVYLDGAGRHDSKNLSRGDALIYASNSMRLTTKLMQVASWLLVQRAVKENEMTISEARDVKYRVVEDVKVKDGLSFSALADVAHILPAPLLELIARTDQLYDRIARLDRSLYASINAQSGNSVADQMMRLQTEFNKN